MKIGKNTAHWFIRLDPKEWKYSTKYLQEHILCHRKIFQIHRQNIYIYALYQIVIRAYLTLCF